MGTLCWIPNFLFPSFACLKGDFRALLSLTTVEPNIKDFLVLLGWGGVRGTLCVGFPTFRFPLPLHVKGDPPGYFSLAAVPPWPELGYIF